VELGVAVVEGQEVGVKGCVPVLAYKGAVAVPAEVPRERGNLVTGIYAALFEGAVTIDQGTQWCVLDQDVWVCPACCCLTVRDLVRYAGVRWGDAGEGEYCKTDNGEDEGDELLNCNAFL
jgi:hypothetical protein